MNTPITIPVAPSAFVPKTFSIPALQGIGAKTIEEHLKLYEGYVRNANSILTLITEYGHGADKHAYALGELMRRFSFEYNGMRNHEVYFGALEGGAGALDAKSPLRERITSAWGSYDAWIAEFKRLAQTRGIGWAVLWYDPAANRLLHSWIDEQHIGELNGCEMLLAIDMWEHSYVADYLPSGKKQYIDDYLASLNWQYVENRLASLQASS